MVPDSLEAMLGISVRRHRILLRWNVGASKRGASKLRGAPTGHSVNIREVRLAAGAEFLVMICGDIMTMPGLPAVPAANNIDVDDNGRITGLF